MAEFLMPSLGADMEDGTLLQWLIQPGDRVAEGDVVAVVDTAKGAIDVEIYASGTVESLRVQTGEKVPVGAVLATIRGEGESAAPAPASAESAAPVETPPVPAPPLAAPPIVPPRADGGRLRISPLARKRAAELGVDPAGLTGSGPDGAVTVADVERSAVERAAVERAAVERAAVERAAVERAAVERAAGPIPAAEPADRQAAMRRAIGAAMARSKREIPHYYLGVTIDMRRALDWLAAENQRRPVDERLLYAVLPLKAIALALQRTPELNGFWIDGAFRPGEAVHLGVAIALRGSGLRGSGLRGGGLRGGGLIAPAIHHVERKSLDELMRDLRDLVQRARAGSLRSSELADATLTVTNLGEEGVDTVYGVIHPPQVAIVGLGRIRERPWSVDGRIESRPLMEATLAADHRASDGRRGGQFLSALDQALQEPEKL